MRKIIKLLTVLLLLLLLSVLVSCTSVKKGNVAVIEITGPIVSTDYKSLMIGDVAVSKKVIEKINKANDDKNIKAIIFVINSPGGSAVASDEIGQAIKDSEKLTIAVIKDVGASGGYWVASAADYVIANRMSFTGSIGVIASYLEFTGLMDKYGVDYEGLKAGKFKDMGSPFKPLTDEESKLFQAQLDLIHDYFIEEIADNRKLTEDHVRNFSDGRVFLGKEAFDLGLVDELGNEKDAEDYIKQRLDIEIELVEYKEPKGLLDVLAEVMYNRQAVIGFGIGQGIQPAQSIRI